MEHAAQIFHAVLEATGLVKPSDRSELVDLEAVWDGVAKIFSEATTAEKLNTAGMLLLRWGFTFFADCRFGLNLLVIWL